MSTFDDIAQPDSVRPFRLFKAHAKRPHVQIRWRYYTHWKRAVISAFQELKWAPLGESVEVIDIRTMRVIGQYTRTATSIRFDKESENDIRKI